MEINFKELGGQTRPEDNRDFPLGAVQAPADHPPVYKPDYAKVPIHYQGQQPACGAHAGTWLRQRMTFQVQGQTEMLSPEFLWINIKQIDGFPISAGTDMRSIFKALQRGGICDIGLLSNDVTLPLATYASLSRITDSAKANAIGRKITSYAFLPDKFTFDDLKRAIYQNGAAIILIWVNAQFWTAPSGQTSYAATDLFPLRGPTTKYPWVSGHYVVAWGYDEANIYFANSFGLTYGNYGHGFFNINYMSQVREAGVCLDLPEDLVHQIKQVAAPKFVVNDKVLVSKEVNVRADASTTATVLGVKKVNATGVVTSGPIISHGYIWWNVSFDDAPAGWVIENNITKVVQQSAPALVVPPAAPVSPATVSLSPFERLLKFLHLI